MAKGSNESPFVIITGDPQHRHGERISQIRSHLATKQHQKTSRSRKWRHASPKNPHLQALPSRRASPNPVPKEIRLIFESPQLPTSAIGQRRMQKFMYEYVRFSHQIHPFFSTVVCAAVSHPALMSSKILNASAWDDLSSTGEIGTLTIQQCGITRRLLNDFINDGQECSDVTLAALVAVLLFDLVNGEHEAFCQDYRGLSLMLGMRGGVFNLGFAGHLGNSLLLIEQLRRAVRMGDDVWSTSLHLHPPVPVDMGVFTLRHGENDNLQCDEIMPLVPLLHDLYISVLSLGQNTSHDFEQHILHTLGLPIGLPTGFPTGLPTGMPMSLFSDVLSPENKARIAVLLQATEIIRWITRSPSANSQATIPALYDMKDLLQKTDLDNFWDLLPGALIWCLIIGVRLSPVGPLRKWFMMQTTRSTCALAMNICEAVLDNVQMILDGLDRAGA